MQQQQQGQQNPIDTLKTLWMWTWWIASLHAAAPMVLGLRERMGSRFLNPVRFLGGWLAI